MNELDFKSVVKFKHNNETYEMFKTSAEKVAILKINKEGKYEYPTIEEFKELAILFIEEHNDNDISRLIEGKFSPRVTKNINGKVAKLMLTSALVLSALTGCAQKEGYEAFVHEEVIPIEVVSEKENIQIEETIVEEKQEVEESIIDKLISKDQSDIANAEDLQDEIDSRASDEDYIYDKVNDRLYLMNNKYYSVLLREENYTLDEIDAIIDNNESIPNDYKQFIKDYSRTMYEYYDGLELRAFGKNLETIQLLFLDPYDIMIDYGNVEALYDSPGNKIIISKYFNLSNEQSKMTLRHELGHLYNNINFTVDGHQVTRYFNYQLHGKYLKEGLNVLFTTNPFLDEYSDALKQHLGYQITTNYINVMNECLDYNFDDYIEGNVYDYETEVNKEGLQQYSFNYIEDILEFQFIEYSTGQIQVDFSYYDDMYEYVSNMYLNKYATPDMTYDELMELKEGLIAKLTYALPVDHLISYDGIDNSFNNYMELNNISGYTK